MKYALEALERWYACMMGEGIGGMWTGEKEKLPLHVVGKVPDMNNRVNLIMLHFIHQGRECTRVGKPEVPKDCDLGVVVNSPWRHEVEGMRPVICTVVDLVVVLLFLFQVGHGSSVNELGVMKSAIINEALTPSANFYWLKSS